MSTRKWVRIRLRQLSQRLALVGRAVSAPTVSRLLGAVMSVATGCGKRNCKTSSATAWV
jgi:hypothetical protein